MGKESVEQSAQCRGRKKELENAAYRTLYLSTNYCGRAGQTGEKKRPGWNYGTIYKFG